MLNRILLATCLLFTSVAFGQTFVGKMEPIPASVAKLMTGITWRQGCPIALEQLSYLTLTYWGFDNKTHEGHLVVLGSLAGETLQIFQELFNIKYPIERMELPETFKGKNDDWRILDVKSADNNNTYGFFCRDDAQNPGQLSGHSYGVSLDINPLYNPAYVVNGKVVPVAGKMFFDRSIKHKALIDERIAHIFAKHGWKWGGYFEKSHLDYMHFQKDMDAHYVCSSLSLYKS